MSYKILGFGKVDESNSSISQQQEDRLKFIERLVYVQGYINREDLRLEFGVSLAAATNDLSLYNKLASGNLQYNVRKKCYEKSQTFHHRYDPGLLYSRLPVYTMPKLHPFPTEDSLDTISKISIAIQRVKPLKIVYTSASSATASRIVVPIALADNQLRWHLRAYDRRRKKFSDFVVHRIHSVKILENEQIAECEQPEKDNQWHTFVKLKITVHPHNLIHRDLFEMGSETRVIKIRAAMTGYFLQIWNIDCSKHASLFGKQYQFRLKNIRSVSERVDMTLAPGYEATHDCT